MTERLVRFLYGDPSGVIRGKQVHRARFDDAVVSGLGLTRAQNAINVLDDLVPVEGMEPVGEIRIVPDMDTYRALPWLDGVASVFCDQVGHDGTDWGGCPRSFLERAVDRATAAGLSVQASFENEFYLAERTPSGPRPWGNGPVYSSAGLDRAAPSADDDDRTPPGAERAAGRRPVPGADGPLDGRQHQPAGHGRVRRPRRAPGVRAGHGGCAAHRVHLRAAEPTVPTRRSVYGFVGATLGARTGVVAGWSLRDLHRGRHLRRRRAGQPRHLDGPAGLGRVPDRRGRAAAGGGAGRGAGEGRHAGAAHDRGPDGGADRRHLGDHLVRLATGTAPGGHTVDLSVFTVGPGTDTSAVFLGVVFGFLSFAGFEAAATLGEETKDPRRSIPRAILGTAIFGGVYFVFVTAVEVMGFGADDAGVAAFTGSSSPLGDLGTQYVAGLVGDLITIGATVSAFGCALACAVGAARLLFFSGTREVARWEVVVPALALVLIAYTLFRNVDPYPDGAAGLYPAVAAVWIVVGIVIVLARPAAAHRAGEQLTVSGGLS